MVTELEVKAVVTDPGALRRAIRAAGARLTFRGMLRDRRFDQGGRLTAADTIFRLRRWVPADGGEETAEMGWKGSRTVSDHGYKRCTEIASGVRDPDAVMAILTALGFEVIHTIDRFVEVYALQDAVARLEWYPRMDVLVEIEGAPTGIESLIATAGLSRDDCTAEPLTAFVARYEARTGRKAALSEAGLSGEPPTWADR